MHAPRGGDEPVRRLTSARKPPGLSQPLSSPRPAAVRGGFPFHSAWRGHIPLWITRLRDGRLNSIETMLRT